MTIEEQINAVIEKFPHGTAYLIISEDGEGSYNAIKNTGEIPPNVAAVLFGKLYGSALKEEFAGNWGKEAETLAAAVKLGFVMGVKGQGGKDE
jgi:hypothetical protein